MDALAALVMVGVPWIAGCALLRVVRWPDHTSSLEGDRPAGRIAILLGYGYFIGLLISTAWIQLLAATSVLLRPWTVVLPLAGVSAGGLLYGFARGRISLHAVREVMRALLRPPLSGWQRVAWTLLLGWLALRFATLAIEVASRPLYPWEAWARWAPKARVWYELGRMVSFVPGEAWLAGSSGYFDAFPGSPPAVPLLQTWSALVLGRWDDSAISWPWLFMLIALALAIYGMARDRGLPVLGALTAAYLVASLPLLDTHVALAGYPDLMLCAIYTLSGLALLRWGASKGVRDGVLAIVLASFCPFIAPSGGLWMLTLVPGAVVAAWPRTGLKIVGWSFAAGALAVLLLAGGSFSGLTRLTYTSPWRSLGDAYLFADNFHVLWYGAIVVALVALRRLLQPRLAPATMVIASALGALLVASMFPSEIARLFPETLVPARAALAVTPLLIFVGVLAWRDLFARRLAAEAAPAQADAPLPVDA
jgi:hypothetical protein